MERITVKPDQLVIVKKILKTHLSDAFKVWVFGSRAAGTSKPFSDLDLALEQKENKPIALKLILNIIADFHDSDLPWKVDLVDYNTTSGIFRQNIDANKVELILT